MPFDPTKSFEVVEEPPASTFDPKKPFSVIPQSGFDPSKPYEVVGETASLRPTTPPPGQQTQPVAPVEGFAGVPQAFPAAEQRQVDLTAQAAARQPPLPSLGQVDITAAARQEPESPEAEIQPIGKPGTLLYGASEVAASVLNRPEYLAAMLNPATAAAVGLRYAPGVAKQFIEDLGKASQGDDQALGRAAMIGIPALVGAVRGGRSITQRMAAQTALERARSASAASSIDALSRLELTPPTMLKRSEAELSKIPGERTTDATQERTQQEGVQPERAGTDAQRLSAEAGVSDRVQPETAQREQAPRPDDTGAEAAAAAVQRDIEIKPAPAAPEQAPPTEAPTTAAVSAAKEGVGETAPSPSAISEATTKAQETQPETTVWHQTAPENAPSIRSEGYRESKTGFLGPGVYVATTPKIISSKLVGKPAVTMESTVTGRLLKISGDAPNVPLEILRKLMGDEEGSRFYDAHHNEVWSETTPNWKYLRKLAEDRGYSGYSQSDVGYDRVLVFDPKNVKPKPIGGTETQPTGLESIPENTEPIPELRAFEYHPGDFQRGLPVYSSPNARSELARRFGIPNEVGNGPPGSKENYRLFVNKQGRPIALWRERQTSPEPLGGTEVKPTAEPTPTPPAQVEGGGAPVEPTWMGKPLSYWKANAVPQKLGKSEWRTQLSKALEVKDTPASVAKGLKGVIRDLEAQQAKEQRKLENQKADQRDADQEALISKIEKGEPVEQSEVDRLLQPDSEWRKKAVIKPPPTPGMSVGPGAASPVELAEGGAGMDIYGIAERVREQRAKAGQTLPVEPGEGISAPDSVERGRELLRSGADAEASMAAFEKTKKLSADDMALARAKGEALFQEARRVESKFGTESQEYLDAFKRASDWDKRSKAMQTEWHKMGQAQQGETDIDTGTFTGLQRAFGEEFTAKQAKVAKEHVAKVQKAEAEAAEAKAKLTETLKALEKAQAEKPKISSYVLKVAERWVAEWGKEAEKARKALAGKFLSPSPEDLLNLAKIARYDIAQIGLDFAKWTEKMVREFGPKVQPYLADAWAKGQELIEGKVKQVRDKEVGQQIKRQITKEPDPVVDLWKRAKAMIDGGETDPQAVFNKLATETGRPVGEVRELLTKPKTVKKLSDEMYIKMAQRRRVISAAKAWVKNEKTPGWLRFMRSVPRIFFIDKIFGHGTVGMITHAGINIFNPSAWKTYWPAFIKQYGLVFKPAYHERMMQDLMADPLYVKARRAGLANDPYRYADDYQNAVMQTFMNSKLGRLAGGEGFDALKLFRQARFNQLWNALPDTLKTDDMARMIADATNHATGIVNSRFPEWSGWAFFAPKLEASRWAWAVKDSAKAGEIISRWKKATPEERRFAMTEVREKATIAGFYFGLLALNQGLLSATGSKEQINFTNPRRGDFLAFKIAGHKVGVVGPMLGMVRLLAELAHESMGQRTNLEKLSTRASEMGATVSSYARGKLSPFAGQVGNVMSQADFQGRPLPWSSDQAPAYLRKRGQGRYSYPEYFAQEFTPIPVSEAIREVWADQGMNENAIATAMKALTIGVVAGGTGARITKDFTPTPSTVK